MPPKQKHNSLHDQMAHLLTGNLRGLSARRLRRQIARDPTLAHQWSEMQRLQTTLETLAESPVRSAPPRWPGTDAMLSPAQRKKVRSADAAPRGGMMLYRVPIFVSCALAAASVGTYLMINAPSYSPPAPPESPIVFATRVVHVTHEERLVGKVPAFPSEVQNRRPSNVQNYIFKLSGSFQGKIHLYDIHGKHIYAVNFAGTDPEGLVQAWYRRVPTPESDLMRIGRISTVPGIFDAGKHPLRDIEGYVFGTIILEPAARKAALNTQQGKPKSAATSQPIKNQPVAGPTGRR